MQKQKEIRKACFQDQLIVMQRRCRMILLLSLAGILVLTGDAREGLVCLEGRVVAVHLEEETNNTCPSLKAWCSDYGSK